jgi:photoactive yellow protein
MSMSSAAAVSTCFIQRAILSISQKELDSLAYGVIQLDAEGVVLRYNAFEAGLSGLTQQKVVGKNFLTQVAPCTDLKTFHGRFREGVAGGKLQCTFRFHFAFKQDPRDVTVTLFYNPVDQTIWVLIQPSESNESNK